MGELVGGGMGEFEIVFKYRGGGELEVVTTAWS